MKALGRFYRRKNPRFPLWSPSQDKGAENDSAPQCWLTTVSTRLSGHGLVLGDVSISRKEGSTAAGETLPTDLEEV